MIWLQTLPAFLVWIAYAFWQRRWMESSRERYAAIPRGKRILLSIATLVFSLIWLAGGVWCIMLWKMASESGLTVLGMAFVCLIGLVFVHLQMVATALTFSLASGDVSKPSVQPSNTKSPTSTNLGDKE